MNSFIMARTKRMGNIAKQIQVSISLPRSLVDQIDKMAEADNRTRSNFIAKVFCDLVKSRVK